jgi:diaminopimelate epimerase
MVDGKRWNVTAMSFGTPHGAVFVDNVDDVDVPLLGSALGKHDLFPKGASIVFIQAIDSENFKARLWQRNRGETPYTVEAAAVAGTAAMMLQKALGYTVNVIMNGSAFNVSWDRSGGGSVILSYPDELSRCTKGKEVCYENSLGLFRGA